MIFNDYVEVLNLQKEQLDRLINIRSELQVILNNYDAWTQTNFEYLYKGLIGSNNSGYVSNCNTLVADTKRFFDNLRETLIGIDFIDFGDVLAKINELDNKLPCNSDNNLAKECKEIYKIIHDYMKLKSVNDRVIGFNNFIQSIRRMIYCINEFIFMIKTINEIQKGLNKGVEEEGLEIQLLNDFFDKETYSSVVDPIYKLYEKVAEIGNVNIKDDKLQIVRMETGSFFIKFIGNKSILKMISNIIESVHKIIIRNYTREGQRKNLVESTELFKEQFDIVKEMKELGMDVNEHEEVAKETLILLMKQSNILLSSSPDVRINKRVLSKSEEIKKVLKNNQFKVLESSDDTSDEVV